MERERGRKEKEREERERGNEAKNVEGKAGVRRWRKLVKRKSE